MAQHFGYNSAFSAAESSDGFACDLRRSGGFLGRVGLNHIPQDGATLRGSVGGQATPESCAGCQGRQPLESMQEMRCKSDPQCLVVHDNIHSSDHWKVSEREEGKKKKKGSSGEKG